MRTQKQRNALLSHMSDFCLRQQKKEPTKSRCQHFIRTAAESVGLDWPQGATAMLALKMLKPNPGKYGWQAIHDIGNEPVLCVVFFDDCGMAEVAGDGYSGPVECGHVSLLQIYRDGNGKLVKKLIGNENHVFDDWWAERLQLAVVPA